MSAAIVERPVSAPIGRPWAGGVPDRASDTTLSLPAKPVSQFPSRNEIPDSVQLANRVTQTTYLVNGELKPWTGPTERVVSPIRVYEDGTLQEIELGTYPKLSSAAALEALSAASRAYDSGLGEWPAMPLAERILHLEMFVERLREKKDEIVKRIMWEIGKSLARSEQEFDRTIDYIEKTISTAHELVAEGAKRHVAEGTSALVQREPRGVVLVMGPFNYPLNETMTILIPALLMGNTVVMKPPKLGVLLFEPMLEALKESFPPGVVNTVYGDGQEVISPIMKSGKVDVFAFIGSTRVSKLLMQQHPEPQRLKSILGLGAKNPAIVLADADLDRAAREIARSALDDNGQRCTAAKRIYVARSVAQAFIEKLLREVNRLRVGMPWERGVVITPLAEPGKSEWMTQYITDAVAHGARMVNRGGGSYEESLFHPAVLYPVHNSAKLATEEQFGPLVAVTPFDEPKEIIDWAKDMPRQQASLYSDASEQGAQLLWTLRKLYSRVNVNSPCQRGPDTLPFTGKGDAAQGELSIRDALFELSSSGVTAAREGDTSLMKRLLQVK